MAQSVERRIGSAEVTGPIPVASFLKTLGDQGFFVFPEESGLTQNLCWDKMNILLKCV